MVKRRKSLEEGHRRKFLVVIDDTEECNRAIIYAAKRAEHTGGGLVLLYVITPGDFQHWLGVETIMRAEAAAEAEEILDKYVDQIRDIAPIEAERAVREGSQAEAIATLIEEDEDIAILVLAAGIGKEGPGPLISSIVSKSAGTYSIPITIVPGTLTNEDIEALA